MGQACRDNCAIFSVERLADAGKRPADHPIPPGRKGNSDFVAFTGTSEPEQTRSNNPQQMRSKAEASAVLK